ncbi:pentatricopeptide repeat-containing protein At5g39710-like [Lotus japonicus]|uniref:pentatricopeptide repeat-containing protein At5g39710-like n=1 Tax=Lotus japonicus TaxID=34305 RepID=UPI00258F52AF|nr:pentatricopeptide repeat-containing protein At5g39710-like [Lotus japonicus]
MAENGVEPDLVSVKAVLQGLCKDMRKTGAEKFLKEMNENGLVTDDNMIVLAHCNVRIVDDTLEILRGMAEKGLSKDKRKTEAEELLKDLNGKGLSTDDNMIVLEHCKISKSFCKNKRKIEVEELLKKMDGKCFATDDNMNVLAHCNVEIVDDALDILRGMVAKGVVPDFVYVKGSSSGSCILQCGMVDEALEILRGLAEKGVEPDCLSFKDGLAPNEKTCKSLIELFGDQLQYEECYNILKDRVSVGFSPSFATYNMIVLAYCNVGMMDISFEILRAMVLKGVDPD